MNWVEMRVRIGINYSDTVRLHKYCHSLGVRGTEAATLDRGSTDVMPQFHLGLGPEEDERHEVLIGRCKQPITSTDPQPNWSYTNTVILPLPL